METRQEYATRYVSKLAPNWAGTAAGYQLESILFSGIDFANEFISVDDELPSESVEVIVKITGHKFTDTIVSKYDGKYWWIYMPPCPSLGITDGGWFGLTGEVTHWRPINK